MRDATRKPSVRRPRSLLLAALMLAAVNLLTACSLGLDASRLQRDAAVLTHDDAGVPPVQADGNDGFAQPDAGGRSATDGCPPCLLDESNLDECCLQ
jgi:hypothetical protein